MPKLPNCLIYVFFEEIIRLIMFLSIIFSPNSCQTSYIIDISYFQFANYTMYRVSCIKIVDRQATPISFPKNSNI